MDQLSQNPPPSKAITTSAGPNSPWIGNVSTHAKTLKKEQLNLCGMVKPTQSRHLTGRARAAVLSKRAMERCRTLVLALEREA